MEPINVLIVDDHPFIIQAYKNALNKYSEQGLEFIITQANDCKAGYELITDESNNYQLAMFDVSMPEYPEKNIHSGEDLAKLMTERMPDCRIILLTMHVEFDKINSIIKNVNPNGLVIKNDITFNELIFALDKILKNEKYYSQTVVTMFGQLNDNILDLDSLDKQILIHLSNGYEIQQITRHVPLKADIIAFRIERLKELFSMKEATDHDLVKLARLRGII
jgi:DNA-binding NarL/FixJ family response regulator